MAALLQSVILIFILCLHQLLVRWLTLLSMQKKIPAQLNISKIACRIQFYGAARHIIILMENLITAKKAGFLPASAPAGQKARRQGRRCRAGRSDRRRERGIPRPAPARQTGQTSRSSDSQGKLPFPLPFKLQNLVQGGTADNSLAKGVVPALDIFLIGYLVGHGNSPF